jgi:hypothetical protein
MSKVIVFDSPEWKKLTSEINKTALTQLYAKLGWRTFISENISPSRDYLGSDALITSKDVVNAYLRSQYFSEDSTFIIEKLEILLADKSFTTNRKFFEKLLKFLKKCPNIKESCSKSWRWSGRLPYNYFFAN